MSGRMDRYVTGTVAGAYFAAFVFLALMFVVFDLLFEMQKYVEVAERAEKGLLTLVGELCLFHAYNVPHVFVNVGPFVTVIACMFAFSRLMAANEICPMIFTGRSLFRVLWPMLSMAVISTLAMAATWQWVIPATADSKAELHAGLTGDEPKVERITLRIKDRQELYCRVYWREKQRMEGVILYDRGASREDGIYIEARYADYNPEKKDWELVDGVRCTGAGESQVTKKHAMLGLPGVKPGQLVDVGKSQRQTAELSYSELEELMVLRPGKPDYILGYHTHFTFPLANLVLILLALPFAVNFERGRKLERVVFSIAVCAGYLVLDLTCRNLAYKGLIHPIIAAWTPTIICGSLGIVTFSSMRT